MSDTDTESASQAQAILPLHEACRSTTEEVELEPFVDLLPELEVSKYSTMLPCLVEYYRLRVQHLQAGKIINYADQWWKLTSDPEILETVTGQNIEFYQIPIQIKPLFQPKSSPEEAEFIDSEILSLLKKGVIQQSKHAQGEVEESIPPQ